MGGKELMSIYCQADRCIMKHLNPKPIEAVSVIP